MNAQHPGRDADQPVGGQSSGWVPLRCRRSGLLLGSMVRLAVLPLTGHARVRYVEEYYAELADLSGMQAVRHGLGLIGTSIALRHSLPVTANVAVQPARSIGLVGSLATVAAVFVMVVSGLGVAARGAEPGDRLWNVTKVLYSDKAKSIEAAVTGHIKLEEASRHLETGNVTATMVALQETTHALRAVQPEDGRAGLAIEVEQLLAALTAPGPVGSVWAGDGGTIVVMTTTALPTVTSISPETMPLTVVPSAPAGTHGTKVSR